MSQENVEIVRRILEAFNAGDYRAALTAFDEDAEWHDLPEAAGGGTWRGPEGVRESFSDWLAVWERFSAEPHELIDAGDRVLVGQRLRGKGKTSNVVIEQDVWSVYTVRDGKVVAVHNYAERTDAVRAAGLSEQDAHRDSS